MKHENYMQRCLDLALLGCGQVAPNPMVGAVLIADGRIIGEGYHEKFGAAHAEKNALDNVRPEDLHLLTSATLYVNLEPCAHFGKMPPCCDLIVERKIPKVIIGSTDPFEKVAGRGIEKLRQAGVEVELPILETACLDLNKRFFTFHTKKRPYIILKWAQTANSFISSADPCDPKWISNALSKKLVHQWRSEEQAILVGTNTALQDNPSLTVREWTGKNPLRVVLDKNLRLPPDLHIFDGKTPSLILTSKDKKDMPNVSFERIDFGEDVLTEIMDSMYQKNILSLLVEGGAQVLNSFIKKGLWDEARVFTSPSNFKAGVSAPFFHGHLWQQHFLQEDRLSIYKNPTNGL
jgi:diaminohydroxyphosphoribosylaminopyrimidine deaminase/5-amino-6-(5-phosphoribosylamino)uracil reductase